MKTLVANSNTFSPEQYLKQKVENLKKYFTQNNRNTVVLGISGGVDSAVTLGVLIEVAKEIPLEVVPVLAPIFNSDGTTGQTSAYSLGELVCKTFNVPFKLVTGLGNVSESYKKAMSLKTTYEQQQLDYWIRPTAFYTISMQYPEAVLVGTVNNDEWLLGWFSQYLDVLGINPIIDLNKQQVFELGSYLQVPQEILEAPPSGGLASGETDEQALGFTYKQVLEYRNGTLKDPVTIQNIRNRICSANFKRERFNTLSIFSTAIYEED